MYPPPPAPASRRRTRVLVASTALVASMLGSLAVADSATAVPLFTDAQLLSGNAFMTNGIAEVGGRPNGSFGSDISAPSGYHPRTDKGLQILGFRSDRERNGWGAGTDDGDFFTPGYPYESFTLQVGTQTAQANNKAFTGMTGSYTGTTNDAGGQSYTWQTSSPTDGIDLTQVASIVPDGQFVNIDVTLTNSTASTIDDVYYGRSVDPDNCRSQVDASCSGSFDTTNTVVSQQSGGAGTAKVSATADDGSYLDLRTSADDSVAVSVWGCFPLQALWDGTCPFTAVGSPQTGDTNMGLAIRTASLAAGASRSFRLQYVLSAGAAEAIDAPKPTLPESTLAGGYADESYSASVAATEGSAPITYVIDGGALPDGLTLDPATGAITGTPTESGTFTFAVKASNSTGEDTQTYTVTLGAARVAPALPTTAPAHGWAGETYAGSVAVTAGTAPVTYGVESGDLPDGLSLDPVTGKISGIPTGAGTHTFTVKATNAKSSATREYTIEVGPARAVPVLPIDVARKGVTGTDYSQSLATAGTTPISYAVTGGALPAGLHLDPDTGLLTGKPTKAGTSSFVVTATNGKGSSSQEYTIAIDEAYTEPGASRVSITRADRSLRLTVSNPDDDGGSAVTGFQYSLNGGRSWHVLKVVDGHAIIAGLTNGKKYTVAIRASNQAGAGAARTVTGTPGWFADPLTRSERSKLRSVPADPRSYRGKVRTTKAASANAAGAAAVSVTKVRGRHLSKQQAVLVGGAKMFRFDSAKLTARARKALRSLVAALGDAKAIACEGYADYGVSRRQEMTLSKQRAVAVCTYLAEHGVKITQRVRAIGGSRPVVVGGKSADRAANRRVVITVTK